MDSTIDTSLQRLNRQGSNVPDRPFEGIFIKARLLLMNDSTVEAWVHVQACTNTNPIWKENVDTAIYSADCQSGFTAFFNAKTGGHYSFGQIDSIYGRHCGSGLDVCDSLSNNNPCDTSGWTVYNPGNNLEVSADLGTRAHNNISSTGGFFNGGLFTAPSFAQAPHYVLVNRKDSIAAGTATVRMQWRVRPAATSDLINPFVKRGANTSYLGAQWTQDVTDSNWWIGSTILKGGDGSSISLFGLQSNSYGLQADWVTLTDTTTHTVLYEEDFVLPAGSCDTSSVPPPGDSTILYLCGQQAVDSAIILNMSPCADISAFGELKS